MPLHPAWVKNVSRRVLWAAPEADITKEERRTMAEFFFGKCAYCDDPLPLPTSRTCTPPAEPPIAAKVLRRTAYVPG